MTTAAPARPLAAAASRLGAIDALRGLVMVLMTVDHASGAFNAGRLMTDSAQSYHPGMALDPAQLYTRWMTHVCAPTFVFLAGLSLALSADRRRARGEPAAAQDRFLITRGLFIAACDPLWISWAFGMPPGKHLLQVLYAIGMSFVAMAGLRHLPRRWLAALALATLLGHEALAGLTHGLAGGPLGPAVALLITGGMAGPFIVAYPLLPWLAVMALGYSVGGLVAGASAGRLSRGFAAAGAISLVLFVVVRGVDGYGNLRLYRDDGSLAQWIHVCKYPPSPLVLRARAGADGAPAGAPPPRPRRCARPLAAGAARADGVLLLPAARPPAPRDGARGRAGAEGRPPRHVPRHGGGAGGAGAAVRALPALQGRPSGGVDAVRVAAGSSTGYEGRARRPRRAGGDAMGWRTDGREVAMGLLLGAIVAAGLAAPACQTEAGSSTGGSGVGGEACGSCASVIAQGGVACPGTASSDAFSALELCGCGAGPCANACAASLCDSIPDDATCTACLMTSCTTVLNTCSVN